MVLYHPSECLASNFRPGIDASLSQVALPDPQWATLTSSEGSGDYVRDDSLSTLLLRSLKVKPVESSVVVPVIAAGSLVGVFHLGSSSQGFLREDERLATLSYLANQLPLAIAQDCVAIRPYCLSRGPVYPSTPGAYRVGTGTQQRMASCCFRSSNRHCPECHSRQSEYTLDGRIPGRSGGHVSLRIRSTI